MPVSGNLKNQSSKKMKECCREVLQSSGEQPEKKISIATMLSFPFIALIKIYQWVISPWLGPKCRFTPTCSQYALEAFKKYGPLKGLWLACRRLAKCHPWGGQGYDPVP